MLQIKPQYVPTRYGIIEATTMQPTGINELREESVVGGCGGCCSGR